MLSSFLPVVTLALSLALHVKGHALITPALGVTGTPERNDATGFNAKNPCGKANIATDLVASNSVAANAQGQFTVKVVNFNGGVDGSRKIKTAQVDPTGEGKTFTPMTIITNGLESPTSDGESDVTVALPPGTVCSGGATKNLCLASFVTDGNFGNCVGVTSESHEPDHCARLNLVE
ncbi:hypothetical protein SISSUDRAFT_983204 [Sistotremastrum suecicum HHB10207 ss-3]|uniref:Gas1-like protein n=1 Tax=Sistotremastrum suecicum HHB10207 ss-3 TaxID=1314776 RepID=A0A166FEN7_9AGAM|nr:hypothetical protein SISSUDRAFT_983204 [Sistotremastrum suecicum HHB10207 ss-3]